MVFSDNKDDGTVNCCCSSSDNEEEKTEITGTEFEDVLGFVNKMGETLALLMGTATATLNSCCEKEVEVETSIVLAIEWTVIGSKKKNVFTQVLCRSPVKSLPQSESETLLEKFEEKLSKIITVKEGMAFMLTFALNSRPVREKVETPIVLALERRVIDSNKKFYQVLHRLLVKYVPPFEPPEEEKYPYPYDNPSNFLVSTCVKNPCDFSIPCKADPPTGLFIRRPVLGYDLIWLDLDPLTTSTPPPPVLSMDRLIMFIPLQPFGPFHIICSCNGVLLCSFGHYTDAEFYLWNPPLKIFTTLPKLDGLVHKSCLKSAFIDMVIAFDPSKSPQYQVIALRKMIMEIPKNYYKCKSSEELQVQIMEGIEPQEQIQIAVYSPQTGEWRDCCHEALIMKKSTKFHGHGVFCKDAIYWLQLERVVCFNLVEEKLQYMDHPTTLMYPDQDLRQRRRKAITRDFLVKSGQDNLLYVCFSSDYKELLVWQLGRDDDSNDLRWSSRYYVDLEMACTSNDLPDCNSFDVVYFMDSGNEENAFFVFRVNGKVIRYDMASRNSYQLCYHRNTLRDDNYPWYDSRRCSYCFPFQQGRSGDEDGKEELYSLFPVRNRD